MYNTLEELIESHKNVLKLGLEDEVQDMWIEEAEKYLGFKLPNSYKWFSKKYEYVFLLGESTKIISSPEDRDLMDVDVTYTYFDYLKKNRFSKDQFVIYENSEEIYYLLIDESKEMAEYTVYLKKQWDGQDELFTVNFVDFLEIMIRFELGLKPKR
ncbi:SMI1/KNR4 family protein [Myroides marinus]|uniref:SMI1/KNR4 family protein n=1 Tax=Myroides marinus TaxID=703342 RepID=UPI00257849E0|nr:SMI1/KNR4 family protein [Myroides marinus]MDM1352067.1 SMI1/KNR4 family protein [Myroides marinus]MDM1359247.1 SMI1/KNR4 family protein [Myroides marinus]